MSTWRSYHAISACATIVTALCVTHSDTEGPKVVRPRTTFPLLHPPDVGAIPLTMEDEETLFYDPFACDFFPWYNDEHRHSGLALHTPSDVHYGRVEHLRQARQATSDAAYRRRCSFPLSARAYRQP